MWGWIKIQCLFVVGMVIEIDESLMDREVEDNNYVRVVRVLVGAKDAYSARAAVFARRVEEARKIESELMQRADIHVAQVKIIGITEATKVFDPVLAIKILSSAALIISAVIATI